MFSVSTVGLHASARNLFIEDRPLISYADPCSNVQEMLENAQVDAFFSTACVKENNIHDLALNMWANPEQY